MIGLHSREVASQFFFGRALQHLAKRSMCSTSIVTTPWQVLPATKSVMQLDDQNVLRQKYVPNRHFSVYNDPWENKCRLSQTNILSRYRFFTTKSSDNTENVKNKSVAVSGMKQMWNKYGWTAVGVYASIYVTGLGGIYSAIEYGGVDTQPILTNITYYLTKFGLDSHLPMDKLDHRSGSFAAAWLILKTTEPLRFIATAAVTPAVARWITPKVKEKAQNELVKHRDRKAKKVILKQADAKETAAFIDAANKATEHALLSLSHRKSSNRSRVKNNISRWSGFTAHFDSIKVHGRRIKQVIKYKTPIIGYRAKNRRWRASHLSNILSSNNGLATSVTFKNAKKFGFKNDPFPHIGHSIKGSISRNRYPVQEEHRRNFIKRRSEQKRINRALKSKKLLDEMNEMNNH